jgi:hypothetical protein
MRAGPKPEKRVGGRERDTPNKRTVLAARILTLAAHHPTAARPDFVAALVDDPLLPSDIRLTVARRSRPSPKKAAAKKPAPPSSTAQTAQPSGPTWSHGVTTQALAALDPLLRLVQDICADQEVRRKAAADIALYFLPHYLGRRTKKRKRFPEDEFGFEVAPDLARELRDLKLELRSIDPNRGRGRKASPDAFAKKVSAMQARIAEIEGGLDNPRPDKYWREGDYIEDGRTLKMSHLENDQIALGYFAKRRKRKIPLSPDDDAREAHLTARVAGFLNAPEELARPRREELKQKDKGARPGRPTLTPFEILTFFSALYPPLKWPKFEDHIRFCQEEGIAVDHPFLPEEPAAAGRPTTPAEQFVLLEPFQIGNANLPRSVRLRETWVKAPHLICDPEHAAFVAKHDCLICGRQPPSVAYAMRFNPHPRVGKIWTDEFMVPICRRHRREIANAKDEWAWWQDFYATTGVDPVAKARELWQSSHPSTADAPPLAVATSDPPESDATKLETPALDPPTPDAPASDAPPIVPSPPAQPRWTSALV